MVKRLNEEISKLKEREQLVLKHSYGLYNYKKLTQKDIAKLLGVTQTQISRIRNNILKKLKTKLSDINK